MKYYNKNISIIEKYLPSVFQKVKNEKDAQNISVISNNNHPPKIKTEAVEAYISSSYSENREYDELFEGNKNRIKDLIYVGFINEKVLEKINKKYKNLKSLILIEPSIECLKLCINNYDIFPKLGKIKNASIITNYPEEDLMNLIIEKIIDDQDNVLDIITSFSYRQVYSNLYTNLNKKLKESLNFRKVNIATTMNFGIKYIGNSIINFNFEEDISNAAEILKIAENKNILVVSAGPSLDKNIHQIKDLRNKMIIIAVGTSNKILDSHGIKPHFRASIDGNEGQEKRFEDLKDKDPILLFSHSTYPKVLDAYEGEKAFFCQSFNLFANYILDSEKEGYPIIKSGFSIANISVELFARMKAKRIFFIGQDLSFAKNKTYAEGDSLQIEVDEDDAGLILTKDIYDNPVYTRPQLLAMKKDIERLVGIYQKDVEFFNATQGGLALEGVPNIEFEELLNLEDDFDFESMINDSSLKAKKFERAEFVSKLKGAKDEIEKVYKTLIKLSNKYKGRIEEENYSLLLKKINKAMVNYEIFEGLIQKETQFFIESNFFAEKNKKKKDKAAFYHLVDYTDTLRQLLNTDYRL